MSKIFEFCIKLRFLPMTKNSKNLKYHFNICSINTFGFMMIFMGLYIYISIACYIISPSLTSNMMLSLDRLNTIDAVATSMFGYLTMLMLIFPPLLTKSLVSVPTLISRRDLQWPKEGMKHLISFLLVTVGLIVANISNFSQIFKWMDAPEDSQIILYILIAVQSLIPPLYFCVTSLFTSCLLDVFCKLTLLKTPQDEAEHAKRSLKLFNEIDKGFGSFFIHTFVLSQIFIIFSLFIALTGAVEPYMPPLAQCGISFGQLMISLGMLLNITALTLSIDDANEALKGLTERLQDVLLINRANYERQEVLNTIKKLENSGPLSGKRFFSITRGTITGMLSISITYLIIIVQFKISVISTPNIQNSTSSIR